MGVNECFLATTLLMGMGCVCVCGGGGGDDWMNPKPNKKLSLGAESYVTFTWKGFLTQFQLLLSSIVELTHCLEWRFVTKVV